MDIWILINILSKNLKKLHPFYLVSKFFFNPPLLSILDHCEDKHFQQALRRPRLNLVKQLVRFSWMAKIDHKNLSQKWLKIIHWLKTIWLTK